MSEPEFREFAKIARLNRRSVTSYVRIAIVSEREIGDGSDD